MPIGVPKNGKRKCQKRVKEIGIACEQCGIIRFYKPHQISQRTKNNKPIRFCSIICRGKSIAKNGTFINTNCTTCGILFRKRNDHLTENNFCSRKCFGKSRSKHDAKWRNPEYIKKYHKEYLEKNRKIINIKAQERVNKNKERTLATKARYRAKNPDKITAIFHNRRKKFIEGSVSSDDWKYIKDKYDNKCLCCGSRDKKLTLDHVIPLSKGGEHHINNIQPLCKSCNSKKNTKIIDFRLF